MSLEDYDGPDGNDGTFPYDTATEEREAQLREEFDEAVFGLVAKGYLEIVPGENGEEDSYRLTPAGLVMGEAITHEHDRAHPGMWGANGT